MPDVGVFGETRLYYGYIDLEVRLGQIRLVDQLLTMTRLCREFSRSYMDGLDLPSPSEKHGVHTSVFAGWDLLNQQKHEKQW